MNTIQRNIKRIKSDVAKEAVRIGRKAESIGILAVSKKQPINAIEEAWDSGITDFGENYLQEALPKMEALKHLPITWHFIGKIQSNKTRLIAENFQWVHTIDQLKIARRLDAQTPKGKLLQVCLQVNIDDDPNKAGITSHEAKGFLSELRELKRIRVRGMMVILHKNAIPMESYRRTASLFEKSFEEDQNNWDTLSMGMTNDYREAVKNGASLLRIGTGIFGKRL